MSIPTNTGNASVTYEGNGSSVLFTIPFTFSTAAEIAVYLNGAPAAGVTVYDAGNPFGGTVTFAAAPAPGDIIRIRRLQTVHVSDNDTTADTLAQKLVAGSNVTLTEQNDGGNETLEISAVAPPDPADVKVSSNDSTAGFLNGKLVAGSGIALTEQNDGSNETLHISVIGDAIPSGLISPFAGNFAPDGWLLCDGTAVSRATYSSLFTAISTMYGPGDGATTFNLPDLRGRVAAGKDNMGGIAANRLQVSTTINTTNANASATVANATGLTLGMTVYAENVPTGTTITAISGTTVTLSANATATATGSAARFSIISSPEVLGGAGGDQTHKLVVAQLAAHSHVLPITAVAPSGAGGYGGSTGSLTLNTNPTGGDQPHNNVQPTLILNYIIKV